MTRYDIAELLPVLEAFALGEPVQFRDLRPGAYHSQEWVTINPETTEFRIVDLDYMEWRVAP